MFTVVRLSLEWRNCLQLNGPCSTSDGLDSVQIVVGTAAFIRGLRVVPYLVDTVFTLRLTTCSTSDGHCSYSYGNIIQDCMDTVFKIHLTMALFFSESVQ